MLKNIHLAIGVIAFVVFVLTGQYFDHALDGLQNLEDTQRLLYRTSHIYLFFAAFINILFGLYYVEPRNVRWYHIFNQSLILLSPILLMYSFVFEALGSNGIDREIGKIAVILNFVWLLNIAIGKIAFAVRGYRAKATQ